MVPVVAIGSQDFAYIRENNYFYVDKTDFIREWWQSGDVVTLITRPRRFGKTLNMSMLDRFFQINIRGRATFLRDFPFGKRKNIVNCRALGR